MVAIQRSSLTRRTVLSGAAAMLVAGLAAPRRAAANGPAPEIRSAADFGGELLALTAEGELASPYALRRLSVDADRHVGLGDRLALDFPAGFHPHSMAARGRTLWVTGAVDELVKTVTVDNRSDALPPRLESLARAGDADPALPDAVVDIDVYRARPALLRFQDGWAAYVDLPAPAQIRSGAATAIALPGERAVAVVVEGAPQTGLAMITRSHLALSRDDGSTWRHGLVADGLGEGYGTVLAAAGERLYAVAADGEGNQSAYTGGIEAALGFVAAQEGAGRPMAAVPTGDGEVSVFSDRDGQVSKARFGREGRVLGPPDAECGCAGEIIAVRGRPGAWLEVDDGVVRAQGL